MEIIILYWGINFERSETHMSGETYKKQKKSSTLSEIYFHLIYMDYKETAKMPS